MKFTAEQIAQVINGKVEGNPEALVSDFAKIEEGKPESITFLHNPKYTAYLYETQASVCIVSEELKLDKPVHPTLIRVKDPYMALTQLMTYYDQLKKQKSGIENPSYISDSAEYGEDLYLGAFAYIGANVQIGKNVKIYPHAYIGDHVKIGDHVTIYSGVKIYHEVKIGNNCIIHANAVIGSDGFGFAPDEKGVYTKVPQIGNVVIEDDVEIGACSTIDRSTMGSTIIRKGVKLDNQIQLAHNVEIGEHTAIASQTGVAGSTKIGKHGLIGGQVGIAGHLKIGDFIKVQAQTGIAKDVKDKAVLQGSPALNYTNYNRSYIHFKNLSEIAKRLDRVEKKLEDNG